MEDYPANPLLESLELPAKGINAFTMVLDKLEPLEEGFLAEVSPHISLVKIGWTLSAVVSWNYLRTRIKMLHKHGLRVCSGGTLLEIAHSKGKTGNVLERLKEAGFDCIEVSNGIVNMTTDEKAELIGMARDAGFIVVSEVGKKSPAINYTLDEAIAEAESDLKAGSMVVVIEGREMGRNTIIYDSDGYPKWGNIEILVREIGLDRLVFEAPRLEQQLALISKLGPRVGLGNVRYTDILPIVTARLGIRGDTFTEPRLKLKDASPSTRFIYYVLNQHGYLSVREIMELTGLPERTVRAALSELSRKKLICSIRRGRVKLWSTSCLARRPVL